MLTVVTELENKKINLVGFIRNLKFRKRLISGPDAVLRSLIRGFDKLNQPYKINPQILTGEMRSWSILSGVNGLLEAVKLKESRAIDKIYAGPNLVNLPRDSGGILFSNLIDRVIVPCSWVEQAYLKDGLQTPIKIWAAGVDENYWSPEKYLKKDKILIYWKSESDQFIKKIISLVLDFGYQPVILRYGKYKPTDYKEVLNQCKFSIFVSLNESQGISLAEAWAMNVPTLVWQPDKNYVVDILSRSHNFIYDFISPAPYLSNQTGAFWTSLESLAQLIRSIDLIEYSPRDWVLKNMTDQICAKNYLQIISDCE